MRSISILKPFVLACIAFLAVGHSLARADRVEYIDGRLVHGVITNETPDSVTIHDGSAEFKIPRNLIRKVIAGNPADRFLIRARNDLAQGRGYEAIATLGRAAKEGVEPESLAAVMLFHEKELTPLIASFTSEARSAFKAALDHISPAQLPRQGDLIKAEIHWRLEMGDAAEARALLTKLKSDFPRSFDLYKGDLINVIESQIDVALQAEKYSESIDLLEQLRTLDAERAGGKRVEFVLLWARSERDRGHFREALDIYNRQLKDESPRIAADRIMTTLAEAERDYRAKGKVGEVIGLYETYGLPASGLAATERLSQLWRELGTKFLHDGQMQMAREAFTRAEKLQPGTAVRDLSFCDYFEKKKALAPGDHVGFYDLGEWCLKAGLTEEARESFVDAAESEILRADAYAEIDKIDNSHAETELNRLLDLYGHGEYFGVIEGLGKLEAGNISPGFREQAEKLKKLTHDAITVSAEARPQQAEVLMQQAERAYFTGKRAEAFNLLNALTQRYSDTPAAARAQKFIRLVGPQVDLDKIERGAKSDMTPAAAPASAASSGARPPDDTDSAIADEIRRLRSKSAQKP